MCCSYERVLIVLINAVGKILWLLQICDGFDLDSLKDSGNSDKL